MTKNSMELSFDSISQNESLARSVAAAFSTQLNPTIGELTDIRTAISEAVTNAIIHGYGNDPTQKVYMRCTAEDRLLTFEIEDKGKGIENVALAMQPFYTTEPNLERSGMGFSVMEAFMDDIRVESEPGNGTRLTMTKIMPNPQFPYEETLKYIKLAQSGDREAMNELVERNMALVRSIVKKYLNRGTEYDDLYQIGSMGLVKAIKNFDSSYGVRFSTYAVPMIAGEIKRFLRDDGMIKVSRTLKELAAKVCAAQRELGTALGRDPGVQEIAEYIGETPEDIALALDASRPHVSIYEPVYGDEGEALVMDRITAEEDGTDTALDRVLLQQLMEILDSREKKIVVMRYFRDKTQSEIAAYLGISQVQVSRLENRIMEKLRERALERAQ